MIQVVVILSLCWTRPTGLADLSLHSSMFFSKQARVNASSCSTTAILVFPATLSSPLYVLSQSPLELLPQVDRHLGAPVLQCVPSSPQLLACPQARLQQRPPPVQVVLL